MSFRLAKIRRSPVPGPSGDARPHGPTGWGTAERIDDPVVSHRCLSCGLGGHRKTEDWPRLYHKFCQKNIGTPRLGNYCGGRWYRDSTERWRRFQWIPARKGARGWLFLSTENRTSGSPKHAWQVITVEGLRRAARGDASRLHAGLGVVCHRVKDDTISSSMGRAFSTTVLSFASSNLLLACIRFSRIV